MKQKKNHQLSQSNTGSLKHHTQSSSVKLNFSGQKVLSSNDQEVWDKYIDKVFSVSEFSFKPNKGRDNSLKITLDLHGMTVQQAFNSVRMFVEEHWSEGSKYIVVITGKSGKIAEEFIDWCANLLQIRLCEPITDSRGQVGSWLLTLKTKK
jgi:DNA-nicking Smr family endonuclease